MLSSANEYARQINVRTSRCLVPGRGFTLRVLRLAGRMRPPCGARYAARDGGAGGSRHCPVRPAGHGGIRLPRSSAAGPLSDAPARFRRWAARLCVSTQTPTRYGGTAPFPPDYDHLGARRPTGGSPFRGANRGPNGRPLSKLEFYEFPWSFVTNNCVHTENLKPDRKRLNAQHHGTPTGRRGSRFVLFTCETMLP